MDGKEFKEFMNQFRINFAKRVKVAIGEEVVKTTFDHALADTYYQWQERVCLEDQVNDQKMEESAQKLADKITNKSVALLKGQIR